LKAELKEFDVELLPPIKVSPLVSTRDSPGSVDIPADKFINSLLVAFKGTDADLFVILTGHGGKKANACFALATQEIHEKRGIDVVALHYLDAIPKEMIQQKHPNCEHAGEVETSLMLAIAPDKVEDVYKKRRPNYPIGRFDWKYPRYSKNVISMFRKGDLRTMAYWGEPAFASAAKGKKFLNIIVTELAGTIRAISKHE
jgi:creatinine amidohydrolase/Fe(II)-dependent formamide hydrolase-like protein